MANLQASDYLYMSKTIRPRINRRDQQLTERLAQPFDQRLFFSAEDPVPEDQAATMEQQRIDLEHGVKTINEVRAERGEEPVWWGDEPLIASWMTRLSVGEKALLARGGPSEGSSDEEKKSWTEMMVGMDRLQSQVRDLKARRNGHHLLEAA